MVKIIISSNNLHCCLGHEIHITRFIIIDMLIQNFINQDDIIVVENNDKKFLYELLFKTVLNFNEYEVINKNNDYDIIDLCQYTRYATLHGKINITNFNYREKYFTKEFLNNILKINYCNTNYDYSENYIVIHHRFDANLEDLKRLCNKIFESYDNLNVVIFNNNIENIIKIKDEYKDKNLIFTDNLQLYVSYLNNDKCKLFISEWSGGGQLSQYCFNGKIMYYFNTYNSIGYIDIKNEVLEAAKQSYFDAWDFKNPLENDIQLFVDLNNLIENIII